MNDAFRGTVIVGALVAFYMAARLAAVYLRQWRKDRRRHITTHVFFLTLALVVTTGIVVFTVADATGENTRLTWWEAARLAQVGLVCAGLRPLWVHHRQLTDRREGSL